MGAVVPAVDEGADLGVEVLDGGEDAAADGLALEDAEANQTSIRFIHEAWVGVKWTTNLWFFAIHAFTVLCLWAA